MNGMIQSCGFAVTLSGSASIVEGLQVLNNIMGITANGIIKDNIESGPEFAVHGGAGIVASGLITGNYANGNFADGFEIAAGSTVIGNTAINNGIGIGVTCPVNVTNNTAINNSNGNLVLSGAGCNNTNNVAP
jgi:hypothetical protein